MPHKPVLVNELLGFLNLCPGMTVVDGTAGSGGHALEIAKIIGPAGRLVALDQDPAALERCRKVLTGFPKTSFHHANFREIQPVLDSLNIHSVDAVILDVGLSSDQLEDDTRGFSFEREGPLDMRMNPELRINARYLVSRLSGRDLEKLFADYGEERRARKIAHAICTERRTHPIETTLQLARIVEKALRGRVASKHRPYHDFRKRHPATKVFQALRIAVNDELGSLREGLPKIWERVKIGGRLAVITFHSLEDRIVKHCFKEWQKEKQAKLLTKKPVIPSRAEIRENPRSRSAKLRGVEKVKP